LLDWTGPDSHLWNCTFKDGRPVPDGFTCPGCQTEAENVEAVFNESTIDYRSGRVDAVGRLAHQGVAAFQGDPDGRR